MGSRRPWERSPDPDSAGHYCTTCEKDSLARVVRAALGFASAHDAATRERAVGFGDDGVLSLGVLVVVEVKHDPVARAAELVRLRGV